MDLGLLQGQGGSLCGTLHSPCNCWLSRKCIFREIYSKASNNADFCWLCHSLYCQLKANSSPLPSVVNCHSPFSFVNWPCVFSGTFLSSSTSDLAGDIELKPFLWVSRQNRQRWSDRRTHTDLTQWLQSSHIGLILILVDSFSGWPEEIKVRNRKDTSLRQILRAIFARNGVPKTIVTDNVPEFCDETLEPWLRKIGCMPYKTPPFTLSQMA